jgi:ApaG protein
MSVEKTATHKFEVSAKTTYVDSESNSEQNFHFFSYKMKIQNTGTAVAQLVSRHWIITDALGHIEEVRGPGVIGLQPKINPGQTFEYESACPLPTASGTMRGEYFFTTEDGETFSVEIPEIYLVAPQALH